MAYASCIDIFTLLYAFLLPFVLLFGANVRSLKTDLLNQLMLPPPPPPPDSSQAVVQSIAQLVLYTRRLIKERSAAARKTNCEQNYQKVTYDVEFTKPDRGEERGAV